MWGWYHNPKPRKPANGIKAKTQRGKFGQSWWAQKWIGALESFGWEWQSRLQRGRSYARGGQVLSIEVQKGGVAARVQGSQPRPYSITIQVPSLTNTQWEKVMAAMAGQAIFAAKLLAGEMPPDIEEAFQAAGVPLFPQQMRDIDASCSCPDYANPCKHIAAVYYLLGEQFDDDPFLLFKLRGRTKDEVMAAMRAERAHRVQTVTKTALADDTEVETAEAAPALVDLLATYYSTSEDLKFIIPHIAEPDIEAPLLRRLGQPPGLTDSELSGLYRAMTNYALDKVLGEAGDFGPAR
jgi:uncharacterized Zn finger protein